LTKRGRDSKMAYSKKRRSMPTNERRRGKHAAMKREGQ